MKQSTKNKLCGTLTVLAMFAVGFMSLALLIWAAKSESQPWWAVALCFVGLGVMFFLDLLARAFFAREGIYFEGDRRFKGYGK